MSAKCSCPFEPLLTDPMNRSTSEVTSDDWNKGWEFSEATASSLVRSDTPFSRVRAGARPLSLVSGRVLRRRKLTVLGKFIVTPDVLLGSEPLTGNIPAKHDKWNLRAQPQGLNHSDY